MIDLVDVSYWHWFLQIKIINFKTVAEKCWTTKKSNDVVKQVIIPPSKINQSIDWSINQSIMGHPVSGPHTTVFLFCVGG